jgi:IS6 family transposase
MPTTASKLITAWLKARHRPMRGLKTVPSLRTISAGHAFVLNLRGGHYEITDDLPA